jgi:glyoxylase-like metal-dependent hydrolase (beta-lactamase superfamily II)
MVESPPLVTGTTREIDSGIHVIPDQRVEFVLNVGIVVGERAVLAIDTAMGKRNGQRVLEEAQRLGGGRKLLLTTTHFHPEHAFGAQPFADATYVCNHSQAEELRAKGQEYIEMFSGFGPGLAELLSDVELIPPDITYSGESAVIDLGGVLAELIAIGPAHTRGDQVVFLPRERVLFAGDLVEDRFLPIFPDEDAIGPRWLEALDRLEQLEPAVVVGGHGEVGDVGMIAALRDYLLTVRDRVSDLHAQGLSLETIEERLEPELAERHAAWDNQMWIKSAVDSFHAALAR